MNYKLGLIPAIVLLLASSAWAGGRKLADRELDSVTAAGYSIEVLRGAPDSALFDFDFDHKSANRHVTGEGTLSVDARELDALSVNTLLIANGAQQGMKAMVNINAVNSVVNVLMNLVINIDSTVLGNINQLNGVRH